MRYDYYLEHSNGDYKYFGTIYADNKDKALETLKTYFVSGACLLVDEINETRDLVNRCIDTEIVQTFEIVI